MALSSWLNIILLAVVPLAMAAAGGYLAAISLRDQKRLRNGFISFFAIFLIIGIVAAILLQRITDRDQKAAEAKSTKRDQVIENMNGQMGTMALQITTLTTLVAENGLHRPINNPPVIQKPKPTPASLSQMTDDELSDYERHFAEKLRAFEKQWETRIIQAQFSMPASSGNPNDPEQRRKWNEQSAQFTQMFMDFDSDYKRIFWADALALRDEFARRYAEKGKQLPPAVKPNGLQIVALDAGSVAGANPLSTLTAYFDLLVKGLT